LFSDEIAMILAWINPESWRRSASLIHSGT